MNVTEGSADLPVYAVTRELGFAASLIACGAEVIHNYENTSDKVCIGNISHGHVILSEKDYGRVAQLAEELKRQFCSSSLGYTMAPYHVLCIYRKAMEQLNSRQDPRIGKKGIVGLKDRTGSGYWRMVLPAKYMELEEHYIDITSAMVSFDHLCQYDVILNQRTHDWHSYYTLQKLKSYGKRIVYDIDDDLWSITPDNPAFHVIGKDQQEAAIACMSLADIVTTTTEVLADRIRSLGVQHVTVIPNALDAEDAWPNIANTGSPDGVKRIFWQGSATHGEDWMECIQAVDEIMKNRDDVRLCILGYLPPVVQNRVGEPHWKGKVEFLEFADTETYFNIIKHVRAEVGLAPLRDSMFNSCKSPIKWLEYTLIGMPTVASNVEPYKSVIRDKVSGRLVSTTEEWTRAMEYYLDRNNGRSDAVSASRRLATEEYDIRKVARQWEEVLAS